MTCDGDERHLSSKNLHHAAQADRYRQMVESAGEVIFTTDINGIFNYVNPAVYTILGYQPNEVVGRRFTEFIVSEWQQRVNRLYVAQLQDRVARTVTEFPLAARSGAERWVELTVNLLTSGERISGFLGFLRDIHDRKEAEARLAAERNLLRTVIDLIPDLIYVKDTQSRYLLANEAMAVMTQRRKAEDLIGLRDFDVAVPDVAPTLYETEQRVLMQNEALVGHEEAFQAKGGPPRWLLATKVPLHDARGRVVGLVGVSHDITERREVERALRDTNDELEARVVERTSELIRANADLQKQMRERERIEQALQSERNLLRTLIDQLPDYIFVKDLQSRFVIANKAIARKMNVAGPQQLIGRSDFDFYPPEAAAQFYGDERQVFLTGEPLIDYEELSVNLNTHKSQWLLTSKVPLRDADGNITGLVGIGRDITARKHSQEQERAHQAFLRQLIDNNPSLIFVKDIEGHFTLVNKSLADLYGATVEEVIGKTDAAFDFDEESVAHFQADDREVIETLTPKFIAEERVHNVATGEWRWVQTNKLPLLQSDGTYHVLGISTDITERKKAEQQSLDLAVERERVRLLANFIRDASHDFRTPLSTINTSLYLLGRTSDTARRQHHIDIIQQQTAHLSRLLEGMLKMTRLDSEHFFRFGPVDINAMLGMIYLRDAERAARKQLRMTLELDEQRFNVHGDLNELERAVSELVKNAIQFTPDGKAIALQTEVDVSEGVIRVIDEGIGIESAEQARIFERFYRADKARSSDTGGVGLGLSIAEKIIEAHDGKITFESVPGQGSVFTITLPLRTAKGVY